ncbi:MAG TPA: hypothetical protein VH575_16125 [Gemmataceae bacterium]|jgi:hypothetical protein
MNRLNQRSIQDNKESDGAWETFGAHRCKLTELLRVTPNRSPQRLCVLGAGNCNDLDLKVLLNSYQELHLVDLDGEALARGVQRQGLSDSSAVHHHGGIDITGVLEIVDSWSPGNPISDTDLASCVDAPAASVLPMHPRPYDVVASTCLLSQLIRGVVMSAGESHPRFLQAVQAVRAGHLRLLAGLVAGGGLGLLITDLVSSESYPALGTVPENLLPGVLARLIQEHNFFHGLNPGVLASFFRSDPVVAPQISKLELIQPWLWDLGSRVYGVCALRFLKANHMPAEKDAQAC